MDVSMYEQEDMEASHTVERAGLVGQAHDRPEEEEDDLYEVDLPKEGDETKTDLTKDEAVVNRALIRAADAALVCAVTAWDKALKSKKYVRDADYSDMDCHLVSSVIARIATALLPATKDDYFSPILAAIDQGTLQQHVKRLLYFRRLVGLGKKWPLEITFATLVECVADEDSVWLCEELASPGKLVDAALCIEIRIWESRGVQSRKEAEMAFETLALLPNGVAQSIQQLWRAAAFRIFLRRGRFYHWAEQYCGLDKELAVSYRDALIEFLDNPLEAPLPCQDARDMILNHRPDEANDLPDVVQARWRTMASMLWIEDEYMGSRLFHVSNLHYGDAPWWKGEYSPDKFVAETILSHLRCRRTDPSQPRPMFRPLDGAKARPIAQFLMGGSKDILASIDALFGQPA